MMIDHDWSTDRLHIQDTQPQDLPEIEQVLSSCNPLLMEGFQEPDLKELRRWLTEGDLPPGGQLDHYRLQTVRRLDNNEVVGYLSLYHGYPDPKTLYIASVFIRHDCQGHGFGSELVDQLCNLVSLQSYTTHRLVVAVQNWKAVKFWVRCGFTTVVKAISEQQRETTSGARLELVRDVSDNTEITS